jgi:hypothetical protein
MSLSKSKYWYSNDCLHFLKCTVPFEDVFAKKSQISKRSKLLMAYYFAKVHFNKTRLIVEGTNKSDGLTREMG